MDFTRNVASEKDEREKDEDISGLRPSSPFVNKEKGSTHSNATLEKDDPEQVNFSDQHSALQSVGVVLLSTCMVWYEEGADMSKTIARRHDAVGWFSNAVPGVMTPEGFVGGRQSDEESVKATK
ncbi:hypothetical protein Tco_1049223 [Tanacetum coccineum]